MVDILETATDSRVQGFSNLDSGPVYALLTSQALHQTPEDQSLPKSSSATLGFCLRMEPPKMDTFP